MSAPHQVQITIEVDTAELRGCTAARLALLWHVAQANPAPHGDPVAGEVAERIGREIIRRWLASIEPELWHHQGRDYYWQQLCRFAAYQPGDPDWHRGTWVARDPDPATDPPGDAP